MADWVPLDEYARQHGMTQEAAWALVRESRLSHQEMNGRHLVQERETLGRPSEPLVPSGYAEKAMASLLRLHDELMAEKERHHTLLDRLMEKEQTLAELKGYVRLLEDKLARSTPVPCTDSPRDAYVGEVQDLPRSSAPLVAAADPVREWPAEVTSAPGSLEVLSPGATAHREESPRRNPERVSSHRKDTAGDKLAPHEDRGSVGQVPYRDSSRALETTRRADGWRNW